MQRAIVQAALFSLIASSTIGVIAPIVPIANAAPDPAQIAQRVPLDRNNNWNDNNWNDNNGYSNNDWDGNWDGNWERDRDLMTSKLNGIVSRSQRHQFRDTIAAGTHPAIALAQLNLSNDQKAKLRAVFPQPRNRNGQTDGWSQRNALQQSYLQQIQRILSSRQERKFRKAIADGQSPRDALRDINLSDSQKQQLRQLQDAYDQQLRDIERNSRQNNDWGSGRRRDRNR
jgi:Spy/CpxP family protein refolding chaperone